MPGPPKVFISSTSEDLHDYRAQAAAAAEASSFAISRMESWPATGHPSLPACLKQVADSDLVVVIVAHRYGWVPDDPTNPDAKSITWLECEQAWQADKSVLAFLIDPKYAWPKEQYENYRLVEGRNLAEQEFTALRKEVQRNEEKLQQFKKKLDANLRQHFTDAPNFRALVTQALMDWRIEQPTPNKPIWNIPRPTQHFQDRPNLIDQIDRALQKGATALTAIHGLPGIGKTQLARGYAQQRRDRYQLGAWLESETTLSLLSSLTALAPLLGVPTEQDQQAMAQRVLNELSLREPWLVIFDNAVKPEALRPYIERLTGNGHVLLTSRNEHWDGLATPVSVTQWSIEESARFLLDRTQQTDRTTAQALAQDLDGLVLALEHAAAYMRAGDGMTLAGYRRVWREKLKWTAKDHAYPASVAAAVGLSLDAVVKENPAAYDLLCLFAWLAPDRIPRKELLEAGAKKLTEVLGKAFANHDDWMEVIATLGRYSLLTRERSEGVVTAYYLHRVVQQVVRDRQAADATIAQWLTAACDVLDEAFPFSPAEPPNWATSESLLPHARAIRSQVRNQAYPASLSRLLNQAGLYLKLRGLYAETRDFQELALESALPRLGADHASVAVYRSNLALTLKDLGEPTEARKQINLALDSDLRRFGPDNPNVARRRSHLAIILQNLGELAEARRQIELALESDLPRYGPDHPKVAVRRANLAIILRDLGQHSEARSQIERALESALRQFGPDHPSVFGYRSNLAITLRNMGEYAEARNQIERALEPALRQFGPDHPVVAMFRWNLASILYNLTAHDAVALQEIERALDIFRRKLPPKHPHIVNAEVWRDLILKRLHNPPANSEPA